MRGSGHPGDVLRRVCEGGWMDMRALVTGASAGLGAELARQLAADGLQLVLVARDRARLEALAATLPVDCEVLPADLTDPEQLDRVAARLADRERPIDVLVSNAGGGILAELSESEAADERRLLDLLAWAPLRLAHAALPGMLERGRGGILTVASVAGLLPTGTYSAAKAHAIALSRSIAARYRVDGIRATALLPGFLDTEFHDRLGIDNSFVPEIAFASVETVAREGLWGLRKGRPVVVSDWRYRLVRPIIPLVPDHLLGGWSMARLDRRDDDGMHVPGRAAGRHDDPARGDDRGDDDRPRDVGRHA